MSPYSNGEREVSCPDRVHQEEIRPLCRFVEYLRLFRIHRESLLTQDWFARFKAEHTVLKMMRVRGRDVDDINGGVFDEFSIRTVGGA